MEFDPEKIGLLALLVGGYAALLLVRHRLGPERRWRKAHDTCRGTHP